MSSNTPPHESELARLLSIMAQLRDPDSGCPWDLKQTMSSLTRYTIEEAYEVADAIANGKYDDIRDELGDLLFQVVFYAQIAKEQGEFSFADVATAICEKLIRRHPHVFAGESTQSAEALAQQWERIKQQEKAAKFTTTRLLDDIPANLPALMQAQKIQKTVAKVGFDWPDKAPVFSKIREELNEVEEAIALHSQAAVEDEIGDLLFAVVNLARHCNIDADTALRKANHKFSVRFHNVEEQANAGTSSTSKCTLADYTLEELEVFWQRAKQNMK